MISRSKSVISSNPKKKEKSNCPHFCHHCSASGHTHPNYFKFHVETQGVMKEKVTTVKSQNPLPRPGELVKALNLIVKYQGFETASHRSKPTFRKTRHISNLSKIWVEKTSDV